MLRFALALTLTLPLAVAPTASAAVNRCAHADVDLAFDGTAITQLTGDTGWFPSSFPVQLRLTGRVAGQTLVAMGLQPTACWTDGMRATVPGRAATGGLDVTYGAEVHLFVHIDTTVLGEHIFWEHEIPIPVLPQDLIIAGSTTFDPTLLPGSAQSSVQVFDTTDPVHLLFTDVISDLISIVGISGGLHVDVVGSMTTTYETSRVIAGTAAIASAGDDVAIARPGDGFGASIDLPVRADGVVRYHPRLTFDVGVDLRIFGIRVVQYDLFDIPMDLPSIDQSITLAGDRARIPLPVLGDLGDGARIDFAGGELQQLTVRNRGEAALMIEAATPIAGVTVEPVTIQPGATGALRVTVAAGTITPGTTTMLALATNDPDHGTLPIALGIDVGGSDGGTDDAAASHAGCSVAGNGASAWLAVGLALIAVRRRRRR
jgi:MYXO-CTERM domain-containing protein